MHLVLKTVQNDRIKDKPPECSLYTSVDVHLLDSSSIFIRTIFRLSGFGGLEVSVLASGTRVRELKSGRSRRIFQAKKSKARLPSEGK